MKIREFRRADVPRLRELYRGQNLDYAEPDWTGMIGGVLVDENDVVQIALLARPTVEMYAVVSQENWATPGIKVQQFKRLDAAVVGQLRGCGYQDQHAFIPPQFRAFVRRLLCELGWVRTDGEPKYVPLLRWIG
jgi:hypothetical protein